MEYLRKSDLGQWTLHKSKSTSHDLINHVLDNPQDTAAPRVLSDYYQEQGRHPGKLIGDSRVGDEPIDNMHPDLQHIHDWEGLHPAVRPLLHHSDDSTAEERQQRIHGLSDYLIREHTPAMLDLHPELKEHAAALRNLPPLRTTEDFKKAHSTIEDAAQAAQANSMEQQDAFHRQPDWDVPPGAGAFDVGVYNPETAQEGRANREARWDRLVKYTNKAATESGADALPKHIDDAFNHGHTQDHDMPVHENFFSDQQAEPVRKATAQAARATQNALGHAMMAHVMRSNEEPKHIQPTVDKLKQRTNKVLANTLVGNS